MKAEEKLNNIAEEHLGGRIDNHFIPRDSTNDVYVVDVQGKEYCIKISSTPYLSAFRAEPFIQKKIYENTSLPVPEIIETDYRREVIDSDFFIMEYGKGKNAEDFDEVGDNLLSEMKENYLKLGELDLEKSGYFHWSDGGLGVFPQYDDWSSLLEDEVRLITRDMQNGRFKYLSEYHRNFYEKEKDILMDYNPDPTIVNSDFRLENILVENGNISYILDWGSCFCGDLNFGIKKMEFLLDNPTTNHSVSVNDNLMNDKLAKFYESLMWMYIMSGFETWFANVSKKTRGKYEQKIREKYKETINKYHSL